jgi:LacI family transcriptional regulator
MKNLCNLASRASRKNILIAPSDARNAWSVAPAAAAELYGGVQGGLGELRNVFRLGTSNGNCPVRNRAFTSSANDIPKIAVLISMSSSVCREMLRGISRYARAHGPWSLHVVEGDYEQVAPQMAIWGCSGIVACIPQKRIDEAVIDSAAPTVAICLTDEQRHPTNPLSRLSDVCFDVADQVVGKLAAEHFQQRQIRSFAYVGQDEVSWSERRERAFRAHVKASGFATNVYRHPAQQRESNWQPSQAILIDWLISLRKPVGVLACNDAWGRQVLESCRLAGLRVPDQVAVLGVDNDAVFCEMADPPLSSVALDSEAAGYEAAELLDGIIRGRVRTSRRVFVQAMGVITRQSTDLVAVNDCDVAAALRFIYREYGNSLSVADVADAVAMSRRGLEKRFRKTLGRTILEEIQLVRIERAKRLLLETSHPVAKVAKLAGFGTTNYFVRFFRQRVGQSPSEFRGKRPT